MRRFFLFLICCGFGASAWGREVYESPGFSAVLLDSGNLLNLKYAGELLAEEVSVVGEYKFPEGTKTADARLNTEIAPETKKSIVRKENSVIVSVSTVLSSRIQKNAASLHAEYVFEPRKIILSYTIRTSVPLEAQYRIFQTEIRCSEKFFGRGFRSVGRNGNTEYKVLPKHYAKTFSFQEAEEFSISTETGIFTMDSDGSGWISWMDSRSWGGRNPVFRISPPAVWKHQAVTWPVGSVWKWKIILTFDPE